MSDMQIRAVPQELVEAAKRRAVQEGLSLSAYMRRLLEQDVEAHERGRRWGLALEEIRRDAPLGGVSPEQVREALGEVREEAEAHGQEVGPDGRP